MTEEEGHKFRDKEKVWFLGASVGVAILAQVIGVIWFFAQMDSRVNQVAFDVHSVSTQLATLDKSELRKTHDDVLTLQKDNEHQNYRIKVVEDWMNAWIKRAEDRPKNK